MTFDPQPVRLEGRCATLEPLALRHAKELFEAGKHPAIWQYMPRAPLASLADTTALIREALAEEETGRQIPFAIIDAKSGMAAGSTRYLDIRRPHLGLEIGWTWLGPAYQRTGINTECKYLLLSHAFETLTAIRVQLKTDRRNVQSRAGIERIGGVLEGTLRSHMSMWNGDVRDSVYYSILREEWPAVKERLQGFMVR